MRHLSNLTSISSNGHEYILFLFIVSREKLGLGIRLAEKDLSTGNPPPEGLGPTDAFLGPQSQSLFWGVSVLFKTLNYFTYFLSEKTLNISCFSLSGIPV